MMAEIFSVHIDNDKDMLNFVSGKPCMYTIRINQSIGNQWQGLIPLKNN